MFMFPFKVSVCFDLMKSLNSLVQRVVCCSLLMISSVIERIGTTCTVIVKHVLQSSSHGENAPQQVLIISLLLIFLILVYFIDQQWTLNLADYAVIPRIRLQIYLLFYTGDWSRFSAELHDLLLPWPTPLPVGRNLGGDRKWRGFLGSMCLAVVDSYFYPAQYCEGY